uniref:Dynein heavy chain, cytoplasmic n=1 Tax=Glossina palpalis gambiensis TaxID=67801 RepID=A0A1B0AQ10_9MUSC
MFSRASETESIVEYFATHNLSGAELDEQTATILEFLENDDLTKTDYSPELSGLLENLHVSLSSTLGLPQTGIITIKDEIKYWRQKANQKSNSRSERESTQTFLHILHNIDQLIDNIDYEKAGSIEEFLNSSHNNLDELWRSPYQYPQQRMAGLMDVLGDQLMHICLDPLPKDDVWNINNCHVTNLMSQLLDTADSWLQLCDSLTRLFWPNYAKHPWIGETHLPKGVQLLKERILDIRNIKNLYKQISFLLNDYEMEDIMRTESPFKNFNIFETSASGQTKWNKALQRFEELLEPIDERIGNALKVQLSQHLSNPRQIIFIFSKYETLIQRPTVLELLTIEREQFVQSLHILLQDLRKAMIDTNMEPDTAHLSVICNECRWLKVVQHEIQEVEKVSHLINDREGFDIINKATQEIKEETESLLRTNFEIWCGQCTTAVKSGELNLRDDQPVVKFEKEGRQLMSVTFNPQLITFCQDVSEFTNLHFNVPSELRTAAKHASKYICFARRLQQIATFHNTIGDRMIPCQRPIMLKNAVELAKLVHSETVAWIDEDAVQRYVSTLQEAVSKLSSDNALLVGYHEQAKRTVVKLMNTDLINQSQIWKEEMRHLRELIASLERQGFTNLEAFKLHWDHQLYKVLEYQYILGLVEMNNKLPDIHVKIAFRQRQLCFIPPEEEIQEKYFSQLSRFIERPCGFRGLSDKSSELFKAMVENNRQYLGPLYKRAGELFEKLDKFKQLWLSWVALGSVDIEELCGIHLQAAKDWDRNFHQCKHYGQKIAKIQNTEESIDCIVIDILPLRCDIELLSRRYWEALSGSLKTSILADVSVIKEFLQSASQFVQNVAIDEASITESSIRYENIMTELPKISEILELVKAKDKCLAGWCKERVTSLVNILVEWEKLQPMLSNHSAILQRQVEMIKDQAQTQMENLRNEAEKFELRWEYTVAELAANDEASLDMFKERRNYWQQILDKKTRLEEECKKFNMIFTEGQLKVFHDIDNIVNEQSKEWLTYNEYLNELDDILKEEWSIYRHRPYVLNEFITKWEGCVQNSIDLSSKRIRQNVELLQSCLPLLQQLQADSLTERHWLQIFALTKQGNHESVHSFTLKELLRDPMLLLQNANEISQIVRQASSEQIVRQALNELDQWSVISNLKLISHQDTFGNSLNLIKDYQEILNKICDNQSLLQSAKNSSAFGAFSDQAELWESRLNSLEVILTSLNQAQRRWVYLEPVFGSGTLRNEEALFKRIDKDFRYIMREIKMDPKIMSLIKINNITTIVKSLESQLTRCQNNLMSYIMEKRNSFPRFYFLGDDDLLEILGQASKDPEIIQKHIKKLFPGCHSLQIVQGSKTVGKTSYVIQALQSAEGDFITLKQPVEMTGSIENWLNNLVTNIQHTLKRQMIECMNSYPIDGFNEKLLQQYVMQVLSTTRAIEFTKQTEKSIQSMSLQKLQKQLNAEISKYVEWKRESKDNLLQIKLRCILFDLVHYVTVVEQLIQQQVMQLNDWHWLAQLRFYMSDESVNSNGRVLVRMVYAEFEYSYEYLGNPNKLVSTRLTHKCYLILTQAMNMGLGGNPFGPAGTGKTECVKALGALLGRLVLVFNCDENIDTDSMALILTGLARCGAWGCFDEFNRLQEATLSTISMLIQPIQSALKEKSDSVQIAEKNIKLNNHCGIFVTLNPAGADYGGRQKLPGNIQALFRPIVMQQPEPQEIARVMLFVEGYQQADEIAERCVELFNMCAKILTNQRHYDWGLRELKTILLACGKELREHSATATSKTTDVVGDREMLLVVRCLRTSIISKLTRQDVTRYDMLLQNVFPEIKDSVSKTNIVSTASCIQQAIRDAFNPLHLCINEQQVLKAVQLHEQLQKRMGVVVMGPPGCGKSTLLTLLRYALTSISFDGHKQVRVHTISPKSMTRLQLLGHLDADTRQWYDGVLTHTAVTVNIEAKHIHSWIVCDGSVDPEWIEALNSVLDDNKLLTLPSGWRIQFGNNVNFIFETDDLRHASPATISRMGIVNMNYEDYPLKSIMNYNVKKFEFPDLLQSFIEEIYEPAILWIEKEYLHIPALARAGMMRTLMLKLRACGGPDLCIQSREQFTVNACQAALGFLPNERHNEFANWLFEKANIYITANVNHKAEMCYFSKANNSIQMYESDEQHNEHEELVQTAAVKMYLDNIHVLLEAPAASNSFLLVGPAGAAKTLLMRYAVQEMNGYDLVVINCSAQMTPAYVLRCVKQNCIAVSGVRGREYKPRQQRLVVFLKNLDLCYLDTWQCNAVVELLQQIVQRQGFYNVTDYTTAPTTNTTTSTAAITSTTTTISSSTIADKAANNASSLSNRRSGNINNNNSLEWINVSGLQICGSISETIASATANATLLKIAPRYLAINHQVRIANPSPTDMLTVLQHNLEPLLVGRSGNGRSVAHFKGFTSQTVQYIAEGLMDFYTKLQMAFVSITTRTASATTSSTHCQTLYQFSPKFLLKTLENLKYYPEQSFYEALHCELLSIFRDRLSTTEDIERFDAVLKQTLRKIKSNEKIYFVPKSLQIGNRLQALQHDEWLEEVQKQITICNSESLVIDAPLTTELLEQTAKVVRLLARPQTHVLLVGSAGSRQFDSIYIAATMQQAKVHLLQANSARYGLHEFCNDFKLAMQTAALDNQCTCLVVEHFWLNYAPEILKPIEALLEESETLDLFDDDLESLASSLKPNAQLEGYQESMASYFMKRVHRNLHIIICLDSASPKINEYFNNYPALQRKMELLFIKPTSQSTYASLPKKYIEILSDTSTTANNKISIPRHFNEILDNFLNQGPPLRFYQLIKSYYFIYGKFSADINKRLEKLQLGVDKLSAAYALVDSLKLNAAQQEEALAEKRQLANEALEMISATMRNANEQKSTMLELKQQTQISNEKLKQRQKEIRDELAEVEPILAEASAAVGQIKSEALSEVRSLRAPPDAVRDILEGVLRLMGIRDTSWNSMKTFLAKRGVKEDIRSLDPSRISPENSEAVQKLLNAKADSFIMKNAKRASAAAAPLAAWVKASVRYSKVIQSIKPLEREQAELQKNLQVAENEMQSLLSGLDDVDNRVKQLSAKLNAHTQEAVMLELKLEEARSGLQAAETLVQELSAEYKTWNTQLEEYKETQKNLDTKSLMVALALNYLAHLPLQERSCTLNEITSELQLKEIFDLRKSLITEQEQIIWESMGLARDAQILENAALLMQILDLPYTSLSTPLLIDPTGTAVTWLKEYLQSQELAHELTTQNNPRLMYTLELAILGLTDQLMSDAIVKKDPSLEEKRIGLLRNEGTLLKQRIELEDKLLEELSNAQDDILKNEKLLKTLKEVKESSNFIDKSLGESAALKEILLADYTELRELCKKAADFYIELTAIYDMSSTRFIQLFSNVLELYDLHDVKNAKKIKDNFFGQLVREIFEYLARAISRDRHLTLALFISRTAFKQRIRAQDWELFVTNFAAAADFNASFENQRSQIIADVFNKEAVAKLEAWLQVQPELEGKLQLHNTNKWRNFVEAKSEEIPVDNLTNFDKLLLVQILRSDLITRYMRLTTEELLGLSLEAIQQPTVEQLVAESSSNKPIIMVTQTENDPSFEIIALVSRLRGKDKYEEISIGRGMEKKALEIVKRAAELGQWVCIKNFHLVPDWLLELDKELDDFKKSEDFRLWLICESIQGFNEAIIYKYVRVLYECPSSIKQKAKKMLQNYAIAEQDRSILKNGKLMKIRVVLFLLLAALQERRRFIPQGWSQRYEFGESDLNTALTLLKWLDSATVNNRYDWRIIQKLIENTAFGGRINDSRDLKVLQKYLEEFLKNDALSSRWAPFDGTVIIPTSQQWADYGNALAKLPAQDEPHIFKLSRKSNTSREMDYAKGVLKELRVFHFGAASTDGENLQKIEQQIKPLLNLWKKLAENNTLKKTVEEFHEIIEKSSQPWLVFISTELKLAASGYHSIHSTLGQVYNDLKSRQLYSNNFTLRTLANNQVPLSWQRIWSGPSTALDYLKAFMLRAQASESRFKTKQNSQFIGEIDLATVYNCDTLLAALKLKISKSLNKSCKHLIMESLVLSPSYAPTNRSESSHAQHLLIKPLLVNGAVFINDSLVIGSASNSKQRESEQSPEFLISFKENKENEENLSYSSRAQMNKAGFTKLPLYNNARRETLLGELDVPTNESADTVLLSGAALIVADY